jgi:hypothetical protein
MQAFLPSMASSYNFSYAYVTYKWPRWLRAQREKQRIIWAYKLLFLDVLFPLSLDKVIFVDADQVRPTHALLERRLVRSMSASCVVCVCVRVCLLCVSTSVRLYDVCVQVCITL